jgi:hypothetical protein
MSGVTYTITKNVNDSHTTFTGSNGSIFTLPNDEAGVAYAPFLSTTDVRITLAGVAKIIAPFTDFSGVNIDTTTVTTFITTLHEFYFIRPAGGGPNTNIYNSDGTVTGTRTANVNNNNLTWTNVANFQIGNGTESLQVNQTGNQTVITSANVVLTNAPSTDNTNTQLLARDATTGSLEVVDSSTLTSQLGPFVVSAIANQPAQIITNIPGASITADFYTIIVRMGVKSGTNTNKLVDKYKFTGEKTLGVNTVVLGTQELIAESGTLAVAPGARPFVTLTDDASGGININVDNSNFGSAIDGRLFYTVYQWS